MTASGIAASNIVAFPVSGDILSPARAQEIRNIGFTHYRHVSDDPVGKLAIFWTAVLILGDVAEAASDPMAALDDALSDLRDEVTALINNSEC